MNPKPATPFVLPESYPVLLDTIKKRIQQSQLKAAISVNQELIQLHWWIGAEIVKRQTAEGWKSQVIDRLCKDIQSDFPGLKGFSRSNVSYMRTFYMSYARIQQAVGFLEVPPAYCLNIPWGHNIVLIERLKNLEEREWYAKKAVENGWSRSVMEMWIDSNLYHRQGKALNNFQNTLPAPQSDLASQLIKDPYSLDFLTLANEVREKEIEDGLMAHIQKFLLELGHGFTFVGRQVPLRVGNQDYNVDLLFYHIKLRCYFVVELKAVPFRPEFTGQMNFYLSVIDDKMREPGDNRAIGLILCKSKNEVIVKYALEAIRSPISVAGYETALAEALPQELKSSLPTIEEIEAETRLFLAKTKLLGKEDNFMECEGYVAHITYDAAGRILRGNVVGSKDAIVFHGRSVDELERAFKASLDEYVARCTAEDAGFQKRVEKTASCNS